MPVHFLPSTRRRFLTAAGATVVSSITGANVARCHDSLDEIKEIDPDLVFMLNDTHIGEKQPPDSPVPSNLRQVVAKLVERKDKPAAILINGDLALKDGQSGDYRHFAKLIQPLREAKLETHLTLGNHDHREKFFAVLKSERVDHAPVKSKHVAMVQTRQANFFLMDSLHKTMVTQGTMGELQLKWLTKLLDANRDRPAVIVSHHNPRLGGDPLHFPGGLIDSAPLWKILSPRRHVKAYVHGHIHDRSNASHGGIHIINTPATSYVADKSKSTTGWTTFRLSPDGVELTTFTNDLAHPWNGQVKKLKWR